MSSTPKNPPTSETKKLPRRTALKVLTTMGVGSAVFRRALAAQADAAGTVTPEMVRQAEWIAGLKLSDEERDETAASLNRVKQRVQTLRAIALDNGVPPAVSFSAAPDHRANISQPMGEVRMIEAAAARRPTSDEALAFLPLTELSALVRTRQVSSLELTKLYLARLRRYDEALHCVVTYTDELAMRQAERADREIGAGRYRGPLHGIPWGAKDLISYPGYPTTWGAPHVKDQIRKEKATVAQRLEEAGAVLIAKLSLGALAMGDKWFGGMTRNPWNPKQGSSGSSAGSASATAAGLVGFAIGSETLGSIVSPSRRCGTTGLRPTFGRVSRYGCMTLSWSMDKLGPISRSVEDCALIFGAIHGYDGLDTSAVDRPFSWPLGRDLRTLRVGYIEGDVPAHDRPEVHLLKELGVRLIPIKLPSEFPLRSLTTILDVEAATAFDDLTRRGIVEGLNSWPRIFRTAQFVPAVEYLRANRIRTLVMRQMKEVMREVDLYVGGNDLVLTNLTGHPTVVIPNGFENRDGVETPTAITFTGSLFGETELLAVAHAYQQATGIHLRHPPMENLLRKDENEATDN